MIESRIILFIVIFSSTLLRCRSNENSKYNDQKKNISNKKIEPAAYLININSEIVNSSNSDKIKLNLQKIDNLFEKKEFSDVIVLCNDLLKYRDLNYFDEIRVLIKLGDAYFENCNTEECIRIYKYLLNKYDFFDEKGYVCYKLCCAQRKKVPRRHEIDLEQCEELLFYIRRFRKHIKNNTHAEVVDAIQKEAQYLVETKDFKEIEFFFDHKLYDSVIHCCNTFLENYDEESQYYCFVILFKIRSLYEKCKNLISKKNKIRNKNLRHKIGLKVFKKIKKTCEEIKKYSNNNNVDDETLNKTKKILKETQELLYK